MKETIPSSRVIRFGVYEVDLRAEELRKNGTKIRLRGQPFQVLAMLLEHPGEIVTRDELRERLWPEGTFVDFDHSLNTAINKIREVLGDSAETPRFVETLPRRGYRFVAAAEAPNQTVRAGNDPPNGDLAASPEAEATLPDTQKEGRQGKWRLTKAILIAGVLVLVAGMTVWYFIYRAVSQPSSLPPFKVIRLTSFPGKETEPALSPDGKMVAFVWDGEKGDNRDIYVMLIGAGEPHRLTADPGDDESPTWSPDGLFIAFHRKASAKSGIYVVPSLGGPERRLIEEDPSTMGWGMRMSWSHDGKYLAISARSAPLLPLSLFLLSVETAEKKQLTSPSGVGDFKPTFSPDGQTLAFTRRISFGKDGDIYTMPVQGGEPRRLTLDGLAVQPAWTSDGREIIFSHSSKAERKLYRISSDGGKAVPLVEGGQFGFSPSVSRQGNRLAYSEQIYDTDIWRIDLPVSKGKAPSLTRLISSSQQESTPDFSPDGKKIAFVSFRSGSSKIWICDSAGQNPVQLTSLGGGSPSWSPDGKFIAFDSSPRGLSDIFVISADGGSPRCLTEGNANNVVPTWSRDGCWIYYGSKSGEGDWQIWKKPSNGGKAIQVTRNGGFEALESFDGRFIFYTKKFLSNEIWVAPVSGGEESLFLKNVEFRYRALTEGGMYFITNEDGEYSLKFIDFAKQVASIVRLQKRIHLLGDGRLALSPDRRSLLCPLVEQDSADIMLIENFR